MELPIHQIANSGGNYSYNAFFYRGGGWRPHFHRNPELIYCISGELPVTLGAEKRLLSPGEFCMVLPNRVHAIDPVPGAAFWIGVFSEDHVPFFADAVRDKDAAVPVFRCDKATENYLFEHLMRQTPSRTLRQGLLGLVCAAFLETAVLSDRGAPADPALKAFDYIRAHYREPVSLTGTADALGYEYHYLSRCLSRTFSLHFRQIVNQLRCEYAARCLDRGQSVLDAALESGFQSLRTFNAAFREVTGCAPSELKRRRRDLPSLSVPDGSLFLDNGVKK